jgi:hypothetical protein
MIFCNFLFGIETQFNVNNFVILFFLFEGFIFMCGFGLPYFMFQENSLVTIKNPSSKIQYLCSCVFM